MFRIKMGKITYLLISAIFVLSLFGCSSKPAEKTNIENNVSSTANGEQKPVTITYWTTLQAPDVYTSNADMICYKVASEKTGINVKWIHPPKGQEKEQFSLMVASKDLPDIIEHTWLTYAGGPQSALDTNIIKDITNEIKQYMPNYTKYLDKYPEIKKMVATDKGLQYNIPYIFTNTPSGASKWGTILERGPIPETYVGLIIRQDLLKELNLQKPETIDELYNVLMAFKKRGIEYPLSATQSFILSSQLFSSAYDIASSGFYVDGDTVKYAPAEKNYLEYLKTLNKFYSDGLIDPDFPAMDDTKYKAKIVGGKAGVWIGYYSSYLNNLYEQVIKENPSSTFYPVGMANPTLKTGQQLKYRQADYAYRGSGAAITTSNKQIKESLTYLDWAFSEEGDKVMNWGVEGDTYTMVNGWPSLTEKVTKDSDGLGLATAIQKYTRKNGPIGMDYYNRLILGKFSKTEEGLKALDIWNSKRNGTISVSLPPITHTMDESEQVAALTTEITTFVDESRTQFILGNKPLSEFDNYLKTLNSMGLPKLIKLKQDALKRYNSR